MPTNEVNNSNLLCLAKFPPSFSWSIQPMQAASVCDAPCLHARALSMFVVCIANGPRHPKTNLSNHQPHVMSVCLCWPTTTKVIMQWRCPKPLKDRALHLPMPSLFSHCLIVSSPLLGFVINPTCHFQQWHPH